jgi:hypothetical protein
VIKAPANESQDDRFFRKSFLKTRVVIGVIGVLLPIVLVGGNRVVFGQSDLLPSLSGYYHSDMRNWFVGSLWAIGSGLLVYLAARRNLADSVISFVAGLLAVGVALFPTNAPDTVPTIIAKLHVAFAALLFVLLGVICFRFGNRDGKREDRTTRWRNWWRWIHRGCAIVIWGRRRRQCGPRRSRICRQQGRVLGPNDRGARLWTLLVSEGLRALQHLASRARTAAGAQGTRPERACGDHASAGHRGREGEGLS